MVKIGNLNLNITSELQDLLRANPPISVDKAVIQKKRDDYGNQVQLKDSEGNPKFTKAVINTHPFVYFDINGNYYIRAFRTIFVEHEGKKVEVITTNPNIKIEENCNLYAKGIVSHYKLIPGSELWDNGRSDLVPHREVVTKGDPKYKIVKVMTRDEVLDIDLKPKGNDIVAQIANLSDAQKEVVLNYLNPKNSSTEDDE